MDLFEKLKAEPPVNKYKSGPSAAQTSNDTPKKEATKEVTQRRESLPTGSSKASPKKPKKSQSLSPCREPTSNSTKKVKVLVARLSEVQPDGGTKDSPQKQNASSTKTASSGPKRGRPRKVEATSTTMLPTKAQKKLFEPPVLKKVAALAQPPRMKRCVVRIKRDNLKELQARGSARGRGRPKKIKKTNRVESPPKSPPKPHGFYIKLPTKPIKKSKDSASPTLSPKVSRKATSSPAMRNDSGSPINKADKKSHKIAKKKLGGAFAKGSRPNRIELVNKFGQRFFNSFVRIKRSKHPLMLIFESNARAQRLLAKPRKSKNLSVSFKDQVEIFGDSSDSDFCDDMPSTSKKPLVTPARLSKVENGKIIGDFELDSSLYVDPKQASTPLGVARKKREKKSFSPLKDDGTPSPRKEHLKLANEKLPPSGLRRLTIEEMDDEDENDECEYIVPIEIPPRRISQTSLSSAPAATIDAPQAIDEPPVKPIEEQPLKDAEAAVEASLKTTDDSTVDTVEEPTLEAAEQPPSTVAKESLPNSAQQSPSGSVASSPSKLTDPQDTRVDSSESFVSAEGEPTQKTINNSSDEDNDVSMKLIGNDVENQDNQPQDKAENVAETNGNGGTPTFLNDFPEEDEQEAANEQEEENGHGEQNEQEEQNKHAEQNEQEESQPREKTNFNNNSAAMEEDMDLHLFVENDLDEDSLLMASPNVEREVNEMLATLPKDVDMTDFSGAAQTDSASATMLDDEVVLSM